MRLIVFTETRKNKVFSALSLHSEMPLRLKRALHVQENTTLKCRAPGWVSMFNSPLWHNLIRIFIDVQSRIILPCKCPYCLQRTLKVTHIYMVYKFGFWSIYRWAYDLQDLLEDRAQWWKHRILACLRNFKKITSQRKRISVARKL